MWNNLHAITFHTRQLKWVFPKEKFVEYEAEDEQWCRYFGIGKEEWVESVVKFNDVYVRSVQTNMDRDNLVKTYIEFVNLPYTDY